MSHGHDTPKFDLTYYTKSALAGGICCSITHGALCPVGETPRLALASGLRFLRRTPWRRRL
jgi:hypothetical protein